MKERIGEKQEKLKVKELLKYLKKENQELFKNPQLFNEGIRVYEKMMEEMEEALRNNVEYFSDKLRYKVFLAGIKQKKGWFYNLLRKYVKYKLKKIINKPPKRLNKDERKFLEEKIKERKNAIATLKKLDEEMRKERTNKSIRQKNKKDQ